MVRISGNTALYLFIFSVIVLFLYVVGNIQGFLEETLLLLLIVLEWNLFIFCISDLYYGIFAVQRLVKGGEKPGAPFVALIGFVYGVGVLLALNLLVSWLFW